MKSLTRPHSKLSILLLVLGGAVLFQRAAAATLCTNLPSSTLQVLDIKASGVGEASVSAEELDRHIQPEDLVSRHPRMLSFSDFVAWFDIVHRIVVRDDGSVCDAPSLVRMGFGASQRHVLFGPDVAGNPCMRQHMLDHEADHAGAFNDVVDRFIDRNRSLFQNGMKALKQTPAPSTEIARARWETGMRLILAEAKQQLLAELRSAIVQIDAPSAVTDLEKACGGKYR
jgi:hypothetical protein